MTQPKQTRLDAEATKCAESYYDDPEHVFKAGFALAVEWVSKLPRDGARAEAFLLAKAKEPHDGRS
jgi:hypothetical protein